MATIAERLEGIWQTVQEVFHVPEITQYVTTLTETVNGMLPAGALASLGVLMAASVTLFILNRRQ